MNYELLLNNYLIINEVKGVKTFYIQVQLHLAGPSRRHGPCFFMDNNQYTWIDCWWIWLWRWFFNNSWRQEAATSRRQQGWERQLVIRHWRGGTSVWFQWALRRALELYQTFQWRAHLPVLKPLQIWNFAIHCNFDLLPYRGMARYYIIRSLTRREKHLAPAVFENDGNDMLWGCWKLLLFCSFLHFWMIIDDTIGIKVKKLNT